MPIKFKCKNCGQIFEIKNMLNINKRKYCKNCYDELNLKNSRKRNKKYRPIWYEHKTYENGRIIQNVRWIRDDRNKIWCSNCHTIIYPNDIEYDRIHGDMIHKKCGLIIGRMEIYDSI